MQTAHADRQTRARGIVVALYRGKVVARWEGSQVGRADGRTSGGAGAQEPTRGRGKLAESWRKARKKF